MLGHNCELHIRKQTSNFEFSKKKKKKKNKKKDTSNFEYT